MTTTSLPVIDIQPLRERSQKRVQVAEAISQACRETGFFYIKGHGISENLQEKLSLCSQTFFSLPLKEKMEISMGLGGIAWRGYFPVGGELTSGMPDQKEGLYFGEELESHHPLVLKKTPLHGKNLFPESLPEFKKTVLAYIQEMTDLSHTLMEGLSLSLGLSENYFYENYTQNPILLFRIFNYPALPKDAPHWGVGEHTDYGVLTILKQDDSGGLEVKSKQGWIAAPPIAGTFVCNIGDMLDRMTKGLYRSTPHRVRNTSGKDRLSFPFFFDPGFFRPVKPLPLKKEISPEQEERWDKENVHTFQGTYGEYLLKKVEKVFPQLHSSVIPKS